MSAPIAQMGLNLVLAWGAGAIVGFERSYYGRAAGFRTHALVAIAAAGVVLISFVTVSTPGYPPGGWRLDPTRLAQGVVTGIGFLGAGVIFKEGVSVQGLTTAASIWATAVIGMLFGLGMPIPGAMCLATVLVTLTVMRWIESVVPWRVYALAGFRFKIAEAPSEAALKTLLGEHEITLSDISYRLAQEGTVFEYRGNIEAHRDAALSALAERLRSVSGLIEYDLSRISK